jgi:hypothetical protein
VAAKAMCCRSLEFNLDYQPGELGLAAITALLLASSLVWPKADVLLSPASYSKTVELIQGYPCRSSDPVDARLRLLHHPLAFTAVSAILVRVSSVFFSSASV